MTRVRKPTTPQRVVGVGASAGGLEALLQLVAAIPSDTGLAIVVLQHLPPSQRGKLAHALTQAAAVPVVDAVDGHRVRPNTIVVVPPRTSATLARGALVLRVAKGGARPRLPIDALFVSLAAALGPRAVGVVLSGSANDGTAGLRAIRDAGGLAIAQEPSTARFDDMPRSAIAGGVAELVLPPAEIALRLGALGSDPPRRATAQPTAIARVLEHLREASGIDFTSYKRSTIERRLARRVGRSGVASLEDYATFLAAHPEHARTLYEDLLIHVTEFFRDARVLDAAVACVADLAGERDLATVRVWVPGCSTGEEVYSLAILLLERLGDQQPLQLFGTDLSERSVELARRGHYASSIDRQVSPERLARFFRRDDHGYQIRQEVRERCVFVRHDLVTDPPFSRLDLVSCRNVLIYLGPELQKRVIPVFHYALNQPGFLVLGTAENVRGWDALFAPRDADARIFTRKPATRATITFPTATQLGRLPRRIDDPARSRLDVQREVDQMLLARYAPACVVVDSQLDVIQFRGHTGAYLEQATGQPQLNIVRMTRDELSGELRLLLQRVQHSGEPASTRGIRLRDRGHVRRVDVEVIPVRSASDTDRHFAIVFEESASGPPTPATPTRQARRRRGSDSERDRLREELDATKEYLRSTIAQHSAAGEELGVVNEELQSTNEELQSTNEELQTAKEELQSTNEELETVNDELHSGNLALREANDDLVNVLASVDIAIIIVDTECRVRRFTPKARAVLRLIPSDLGRPVDDLQPRVPVPGLEASIARVIDTLEIHESEVRDPEAGTFRMQIRPYRTADHQIAGAVISFVDVTQLRRSVEEAQAAHDFATTIVQTVPTPLVVLDAELRVHSANHAFVAAFDRTRDPSGRPLLTIGEWRADGLRARLQQVVEHGVAFEDVEVEHRANGESHVLAIAGTPIAQPDGTRLVLVGIADLTDHRRLEQARLGAERERDAFLSAVSHELRTPLSAILLWAEVLRNLERSDPRWTTALETIERSAASEANLVDDLIDLARSRDGELAVASETIEPATIIRAAIDAIRPVADEKHLELAVDVAGGAMITADSRRLLHVAMSLLSNAVKFTPAGGAIRVTLARVVDQVELRVSDDGQGIPAAFLPRLFEPFAREDSSITRPQRGLGIGLALVRHLVDRQRGTIAVESTEGAGTSFTVRFPVSHASSP